MLNLLTIDLEDYFQVHAFSNAIRFEDWGNYESRIERNTYRILEILNECVGPNNPTNSTNSSNSISVLSPGDSNCLPSTSNLKPQCFDFLPPTLNLKPQSSIKATFFILAWLAERYPNLIRTIKDQGHEIACHGYAHNLIYTRTKEEFRNDIRKAKAILEDITGSEVCGYRAPSYSITNKSQWAFEVLMEEGFRYDSSIFPIHHDFYGFPQAPRFPFLISMNGNNTFEFSLLNFETAALQHSNTAPRENSASNLKRPAETKPFGEGWSAPLTSSKLIEFPISTLRICGQNFPISGGGYFRLFPYSVVKKGLERINRVEGMPFIFYLHPWEIDPDQPRLNSVSFRSRFRHYINLDKTESKFKKLLNDFNFSSIKEVIELKNSITPQTQ